MSELTKLFVIIIFTIIAKFVDLIEKKHKIFTTIILFYKNLNSFLFLDFVFFLILVILLCFCQVKYCFSFFLMYKSI